MEVDMRCPFHFGLAVWVLGSKGETKSPRSFWRSRSLRGPIPAWLGVLVTHWWEAYFMASEAMGKVIFACDSADCCGLAIAQESFKFFPEETLVMLRWVRVTFWSCGVLTLFHFCQLSSQSFPLLLFLWKLLSCWRNPKQQIRDGSGSRRVRI